MVRRQLLILSGTRFDVTDGGVRWFAAMGIDCAALEGRRSLSRARLD
jgi:hypothetical protein